MLQAAEVRDAARGGIEDAQAGVEAIKAAGMLAVGVGAGLRGSDWRVKDTTELTAAAIMERFDRLQTRRT